MLNRALVTGATGYLGSNLVKRLVRDGWDVHIVTRTASTMPDFSEFTYTTNHVHDGTTLGMVQCLAKTKPNVVFHLASMVQAKHDPKDIESMLQSNVLFATQLAESMRINGVTNLVNTGTFWQHFDDKNYNPVCLYAATKQAFESILEYYVQVCDLRVVTLLLFDNYGPDDQRLKLFNLLNRASSNGKSLDMSPGDQLIDLVYIDDVVEAYVIAARLLLTGKVKLHERYKVSSGVPIRLRDLVQLYSELSPQPVLVNWGARAHRPREVMEPWSKGIPLPDWKPTVSLRDGIKAVIRSIQK
jgi:nucleoside-diphosphate-sugar epimerase